MRNMRIRKWIRKGAKSAPACATRGAASERRRLRQRLHGPRSAAGELDSLVDGAKRAGAEEPSELPVVGLPDWEPELCAGAAVRLLAHAYVVQVERHGGQRARLRCRVEGSVARRAGGRTVGPGAAALRRAEGGQLMTRITRTAARKPLRECAMAVEGNASPAGAAAARSAVWCET